MIPYSGKHITGKNQWGGYGKHGLPYSKVTQELYGYNEYKGRHRDDRPRSHQNAA